MKPFNLLTAIAAIAALSYPAYAADEKVAAPTEDHATPKEELKEAGSMAADAAVKVKDAVKHAVSDSSDAPKLTKAQKKARRMEAAKKKKECKAECNKKCTEEAKEHHEETTTTTTTTTHKDDDHKAA